MNSFNRRAYRIRIILNISFWSIDETWPATTNSSQGGSGSNINEEVFPISSDLQNWRLIIRYSSVSYPGHTGWIQSTFSKSCWQGGVLVCVYERKRNRERKRGRECMLFGWPHVWQLNLHIRIIDRGWKVFLSTDNRQCIEKLIRKGVNKTAI